jgi:hypothetical protein
MTTEPTTTTIGSTTTTSTDAPLFITDEEIDAINAARDALTAISDRLNWERQSKNDGAVEGLAEAAEYSLFHLLNRINSHTRRGMTYRQLHNRDPQT